MDWHIWPRIDFHRSSQSLIQADWSLTAPWAFQAVGTLSPTQPRSWCVHMLLLSWAPAEDPPTLTTHLHQAETWYSISLFCCLLLVFYGYCNELHKLRALNWHKFLSCHSGLTGLKSRCWQSPFLETPWGNLSPCLFQLLKAACTPWSVAFHLQSQQWPVESLWCCIILTCLNLHRLS